MKKGHIVWDEDKKAVFPLLDTNLTDEEIAKKVKCGVSTVKKVAKAKATGQIPPDKQGEVTPATVKTQTVAITDALSETSLFEFIPHVQRLPLTPDIFMSYMCGLKKGYEGSIAEWLSLVSRDFWLGREINFYAEVSGIQFKEGKEAGKSAKS